MKTKYWIVLLVAAITCITVMYKLSKNDDAIKIGAAVGETGICADWGEGEFKAAQLAVDEANSVGGIAGKKIELIAEDTQCDAKGTINAVKKLIDVDHVESIIGPTWGDSFQGSYPLITSAHIVAVSPSISIEPLLVNNQDISYIFS